MAEITYKDIEKVNKEIKTTDVKGKEYAEVPQRVTAFRKLYPQGTINTEIISLENGVCVMKATVSSDGVILGEGTAYEKENSSFINRSSYIENCETSAVGRALGFAGFGINTSIASAEEVMNAINNQEKSEEKKNAEDSKKFKANVEKKKAEVKKLMEETNADVSAFLVFFTDKFERKIDNVDMMLDPELNEALKLLKQKKADMDKTPKQMDLKGAING